MEKKNLWTYTACESGNVGSTSAGLLSPLWAGCHFLEFSLVSLGQEEMTVVVRTTV